MKMSVREARANFAHALSVAESGERVVITKNGAPVAELGPPASEPVKKGLDWARLEQIRKELGIKKSPVPLDEAWRKEFDSPKWAYELFGPEYGFDEPPADA